MESSIQLAKRVREVFINGKWVANTNYTELLSKFSHNQVNEKIASLNSILALSYHVNYYLAGILNVFDGGALEIRDKYSFDYLPVSSQVEWENMVRELEGNAEKFASHVENMSDQQLDSVFVDEKYGSYKRNIEGVIEHSYYHLGQISLIAKLISEKEKQNSL